MQNKVRIGKAKIFINCDSHAEMISDALKDIGYYFEHGFNYKTSCIVIEHHSNVDGVSWYLHTCSNPNYYAIKDYKVITLKEIINLNKL